MKTFRGVLLSLLLWAPIACGGDDTGATGGTTSDGGKPDASTGGAAGSAGSVTTGGAAGSGGSAANTAGSSGTSVLDATAETTIDAPQTSPSDAPADAAQDVPTDRVVPDASQETSAEAAADAAQDISSEPTPDAALQDPMACIEQHLQDAVTAGHLDFMGTPNCQGSTPICCVDGGPVTPCGPVRMDLTQPQGNSSPRLVITHVPAAMRDDVILRGPIKTVMPIPAIIPVFGLCDLNVDSAPGTYPDIEIDFPINRVVDTDGGVHAYIGDVQLTYLESGDVSLSGGIGCSLANLGQAFFIGTLKSFIADELKSEFADICQGP
jgi:hypothetical protein